MKNLIFLTLIGLCFISINETFSQLQNPYNYTCEEVTAPPINQSFIGGQYKPESIDRYTSDPDAVFPVLVVFVQFANDQGPDGELCPWHVGEPPSYLNNVIARYKTTNYGTNWWNAYIQDDAILSDFWMEASRFRHLHITGQAVSVILPHEYTYYQSITQVNDDIYAALQQNLSINWLNYDKWSWTGSTFQYQRDGYVDMIYNVFRSHNPVGGMPAGGIACLYESYSQGQNYLIYNQGGTQIYIHGLNGSMDFQGSGLIMTPGYGGTIGQPSYVRYGPMTREGTVSFSQHEHGHYLFGYGHQNYGKMTSGTGLDEFLSPYEMLRMGYMQSIPVVFNSGANYSIYDYSSRDDYQQGQILEVPVNGSNEFFLISDRSKESYYDVVMWGDTAHDIPHRIINPEYGKGVYIYHANPGYSGYPWPISTFDQECADGLWNWAYVRDEHPDWSCEQLVGYNRRTSVVYDYNDNGNGSGTNNDGKSFFQWFGTGQKEFPLCQYGDGTDRIFTNDEEAWTSREGKGDRWDPWKVEYNQVFSPYSSPSTRNWSHQQTGIYIYLESTNGGAANFKIYKTGEGNYTEEDILVLTPPSRPMGLELSYSACENGVSNPILTWHHNMEPDMIIPSVFGDYKIYKIYRTSTGNLTELPDENNYQLIATIHIPVNDVPTYRDNNTQLECDPFGEPDINYAVRYRITAVDGSDWESVKSDFVSDLVSKVYENRIRLPENTPKIFSLLQNYPNPFNPTTVIKYTIPYNGFVSLKVYNLLGEEAAELVNEHKTQGVYNVTFDGSNLASGVYFYKLEMGNYTSTKKMVLIK